MKVSMFGKQMELKTEAVVIVIAILILLGCLAGYIFFRDDNEIIIETGTEAAITGITSGAAMQSVQKESQTTAKAIEDGVIRGEAIEVKETIKVYVVGCVKEPGIVTLEKGQLIDDAVRKAGGLTEGADAGSINMVYELNENLMLYIKSKKELEPLQNTAGKVVAAKNAAINSSLGRGAVIIKDSGNSVEVVGDVEGNGGGSSNSGNTACVNINTADADELDTLPGVGEATARDIIAFREKNGAFRKIEDIMKVPRIKQSRFENVKEFITVD